MVGLTLEKNQGGIKKQSNSWEDGKEEVKQTDRLSKRTIGRNGNILKSGLNIRKKLSCSDGS